MVDVGGTHSRRNKKGLKGIAFAIVPSTLASMTSTPSSFRLMPRHPLTISSVYLLAHSLKSARTLPQIVKSTFWNGDLEEEVYIEQPDSFSLPDDGDMVCKLKKALYGLKQAPRA
ncbi:hypothetical protein SUGI_0196420 [Cryptomeria japonica]|nr:hypothetical protein SUGI_0196420 [Cryptomeria japonica]